MGLEGTLRLFSLNDIFQMLGLQRKTGLLLVEGKDDTIRISFRGGQVVSADSARHDLENRLGRLLVRAGRVEEADLERALAVQKASPQRLGALLLREGLARPEDLRDALRLQVLRILAEPFGWKEGLFRFDPDARIDDDAEVFSPLSTESILMEVAQRADEWPRLRQKVSSADAVYRKAPGVEELRLVASPGEVPEGSLVVSRREAEVWRFLDGRTSVAGIAERAFLSDFEVYKAIAELIDRSLILEGRVEEEPPPAPPMPQHAALTGRIVALWSALAILLAISAYFLPRNPANILLRPPAETPVVASFLGAASLERLIAIERAVRVYYDSSGRYPRSLEDLVVAGIVQEDALRDPYGRFYRYILRAEDGKFGLYGRNARGQIDLDLSLERSLAPVSELRPASTRAKPLDARPSVQVVE
jgi:hypothetical protein